MNLFYILDRLLQNLYKRGFDLEDIIQNESNSTRLIIVNDAYFINHIVVYGMKYPYFYFVCLSND